MSAERAVLSRQAERSPPATHGITRLADAKAVQTRAWLREDASTSNTLLDLYLQGWAESNPAKIFAATTHDYRFEDPLIGLFSRLTLPAYFEYLQRRFARAGATAQDLAVFIHGSMTERPNRREFFREAPRLGLSGTTVITMVEHGVISESVAYDLNLASDLLRNTAC
jgi:hypothetical protein